MKLFKELFQVIVMNKQKVFLQSREMPGDQNEDIESDFTQLRIVKPIVLKCGGRSKENSIGK